ncbi:MAG: sigma-54-dependent transcriptional regulator [Clostridia bacterium]|jgi:two-component system response regulator AtoC
MTRTVLIAEDETNIRSAIREYLQADGWEVLEARNGLEARDLLQQTAVDVLVSDIRMPGLDGHGLLAWVQKDGPGMPVLLITAHGDVDEAVQALQQGAADYMLKPFDLSELSQRLERCLLMQSQQRARRLQPQVLDDSWHLPAEGALKPILDLAGKAAPTDSTILISGESGTGKEVIARFIHVNSKRRDGPFVPVNAGAIPESLIESELFGHEKGAFSGAIQRRIGYFEAAQRGTLFLDEIGELPLFLQVKLLRVLQERTLTRLGSTVPVPLDIRIVAATNRNLTGMVKEGTFREDLYYRIQVINLHLPPLRERKDDIPGLAAFLLPRLARRLVLNPAPVLDDKALLALQAYPYPGNVRELENILERALIIGSGTGVLSPEQLGLSLSDGKLQTDLTHSAGVVCKDGDQSIPLPEDFLLENWERYAIMKALACCEGNRTKAAGLLGMGRRTLQEKLKLYALDTEPGTAESS